MKKPQNKQTSQQKPKGKLAKLASLILPAEDAKLTQLVIYGCLAAILLFTAILRYRLLDFPLERDEGEYALMGQLILKGIPPYEMAYNMKLPGTYYLYALFMSIFGQSATGIHLGLLLVNLASVLLLFYIGKKLANGVMGLFAAASYALLSLSPTHLGFAAHATHFIVLFGLGGFLALLHYAERPNLLRLALSGFCFGLSFIMKQQAVFLMFFGLIALSIIEWQKKPFQVWKSTFRIGMYGAAMALPYVLVIVTAYMTGTFDQFWHWTMEYAREYAGIKNSQGAIEHLMSSLSNVTDGMKLFWGVGAIGMLLLFFSKALRPYRWLLLLFAIFSFACVVPGYYFRRHYYIVFLPALSLFVGVSLTFVREQLHRQKLNWLSSLPFLVFAFMLYHSLNTHRLYFFEMSPIELCKRVYSPSNPFVESIEVAQFIKSHTTEQDKIAILGSEPQICFYSNRLPATGYIYTYPLTENQVYSKEMRLDMIAEIEKNEPKYLLFINSSFSWGSSSEASKDIIDWYKKSQANYNMVGVIDLDPTGKGTFVWGEEANTYKPKNEGWIWVHERK